MDDLEQAAWNEAFVAPQEAVADTGDAVADTAAADTDTEAAAHTQNDSAEDAAVEDSTVAEDADKTEGDKPDVDKSVETSADDDTTKDDTDYDSQDLLDPIPTPEAILAKFEQYRLHADVKSELTNLATQWRTTQETLNKIGGEAGIEALEPVVNLISSSTPSYADAHNAYAALFKNNQVGALRLVGEAMGLFLSDEPSQKEFSQIGDAILSRQFGEGVTADHIRDLVRLEQSGFYDVNNDLELLASEGTGSQLYKKQDAIISELKSQLAQKDELIANPEKFLQTDQVQASDEFAQDFETKLSAAVDPLIERGRWGAETPLAKLAQTAILSELRNEPEYKDAVKFIQQMGEYKNGDKLPFVLVKSISNLVNKGKQRFDATIREVNSQFKGLSETSRNAQVKAKVEKATKAKSETLSARPQSPFSGLLDVDDAEAKAFKEASANGAFAR